jgi:aminopeptidase-like protein|tara:strand:- start:25 stop:1305 length:1281 start_codon:yes stop_codon:yes gene_type:complete
MIGYEIHNFARQLWKLNRSLTGEGVRETLLRIGNHLPDMVVHSVPSNTKVFDWTVPKEWHVREAYIVAPNGKKICDFSINNLHLVGYSVPFEGNLSLNELKKKLYTLPEQPDAIPYVTSYYEERWGFCLSQNEFDSLEDGDYKIKIDSELFKGKLNYGELIIPGKSEKEVFLSTYICHPSMANNELSGPTVVTYLANWLCNLKDREFTYRIIFVPETIGSITYLSINHIEMKKKIFAGFNVSCIGDNRAYSYLPSRDGKTISDDVAKHVLAWIDPNFIKYTWLDRGSDERQYCSPGIDLPIASILRTKWLEYPEYHTSLDNLEDVVTPKGLDGGYWAIRKSLELIERNKKFKVTVLGEPQMSKRDFYPTLSIKKINNNKNLMMDFITMCDGNTSVLDIANKLNIPAWDLYDIIDKLKSCNLIVESN